LIPVLVISPRFLPNHAVELGDELEMAVALCRTAFGVSLDTVVERGGTIPQLLSNLVRNCSPPR